MRDREKEYESIIRKLAKDNVLSNTKLTIDIGSEVANLSEADYYTLCDLCHREVEKVEKTSSKMENSLRMVSGKYDNRYHQLVWQFEGEFQAENMIDNYNKLIKDYPIFRRNYIQKKLAIDVTVTYKPINTTFPITDVTSMDDREKVQKVVNIIAAESRREYNPENSMFIRLQVCILDKNSLVAIISYVPKLIKEENLDAIKEYVFNGLQLVKGKYKKIGNVTDDVLKEKDFKRNELYWKKQLSDLGNEVLLPGELNEQNQISNIVVTSSVNKQIDKETYDKLCIYAAQNDVKKKSILLYAWGVLLGSYNNENKIVTAVVGNQNEPPVYPVTVERSESMDMAVSKIEKQWENAREYHSVDQKNKDMFFTGNISKHFHFKHHFLDIEEMIESGEIVVASDTSGTLRTGLTINYDIFAEECRMNYAYYSDSFNDDSIEQIHSLYMHFLREALAGEIEVFDKNKFISASESNVEKKNKLEIAQRALHIKETKLFGLCSAKEIMDMADKAILQKCVVDDELVFLGDSVNSIGIVAGGMIEESITDRRGYVKSMRLLSPGAVFGLEALIADPIATSTFTVASENASVVWIKKEDLVEFLNKKPDLWREFLSYEHMLLGKMQQLWAIE